MSAELITPRLRLLSLSAAQLEHCLNKPAALEAELGFSISRELIDANVTRAITMKLAKMAVSDARFHDWLTYWLIVIKDMPAGVGLIGYKGYPNERGETEIGYGIETGFRNKGFMKEAVKALVAWAFMHPECRAITAHSVFNPASKRILEQLGWCKLRQGDGFTDWEISKS
jgi:RimJ/RimL family protein N-acetyltransferase